MADDKTQAPKQEAKTEEQKLPAKRGDRVLTKAPGRKTFFYVEG